MKKKGFVGLPLFLVFIVLGGSDGTAAQQGPQAPIRPAQPTAGFEFRDCETCPEMVVVPPGSFQMGSPPNEPGRFKDESPVRTVRINKAFAVGKFEVTQAEYEAVMGSVPSYHKDPGFPAVAVSWEDAQEYVRKLSQITGKTYRLSSEAEWEYVTRAGTKTTYWWGNDIGKNRADCFGCGVPGPRKKIPPVGRFPPNPFGLYDVHGNVWEWVEDCYHGSYAGAPSDGTARRDGDCEVRVARGGSSLNMPRTARAAVRFQHVRTDRIENLGFRVVRDLLSD